ncbi:uncharacterized protein LOC129734061 [Wyeomyia smithii]|uniref:uncharacterized protein LOC129734061 n=1 Tax=Wyeomyia smithii TaxID=174621 RepID=UPI0024681ECF|nr:uncharacterized protein LOC129734061 [Wyeomyia smithii]
MDWRAFLLVIFLATLSATEENPCVPRCVTFEEINTLWANENYELYWQCDPVDEDVWVPVLRVCAPETLFSFRQQTCVHPDEWEEVCVPGEGTPDDGDDGDPGDNDPGEEDSGETDPGDEDTDDPDDPGDKDPDESDPDDTDPGETDPDDENSDDKDPDETDPDDKDPDDTDPEDKDPDDTDPNDPEGDVDPCVPRCETFKKINTLWAHEDPERYWQCDPLEENIWIPVLKICAPETLFSFRQQTCVHPDDWEEVCVPGESTPDDGDDIDPDDEDPDDKDPDETDPGDEDPDDKDPDDPDDKDPDDPDDKDPDDPDDKDPGDADPDETDPGDEDPDDPDDTDPDDKDPDDTDPEDKDPDDTDPDDPESDVDPCVPRCETFREINTLWAHEDPERYWQCDPLEENIWIPVLRICAPETLFSFRQQTCVHPDDWEEVCVPGESTPDDGDDTDPDDNDPDDEDPDETDPGDEDPDDKDPDDPDDKDPGDEDPDDPDDKDPDDPDDTDPDDKDPDETDPDDTDPDDPENDVDPCIPRCETFKEINTLWAHEDPEHYWQCDPLEENVWIPVLRICAPETLFSFRQQTCVHPDDWEEVCVPGESTPDDGEDTDPDDKDPDDEDPDETDPGDEDPDDKDPDDPDDKDPDDPDDTDPDDKDPGEEDPDDPDDKDPDDPDDTDPDDKDPDETDPDDTDPDDPVNDVDPCVPRCETFKEINTLWAHEDPKHYWQCDPLEENVWIPVLRICAPETLFSFRQQTCVHPDDWEEVCVPGESTPDDGEDTDPDDKDPDDEHPDETDPGDEDTDDPDVKDPDDPDDTDPDDTDPDDEDPDDTDPDDTDPDDTDPDDNDPGDDNPDDKDPDDKDPDDTDPDDETPDDDEPDDENLCPEPACLTFQEINTLWAIPDPNFFLQCRPTDTPRLWVFQEMPCAPGTWFNFRIQVCVFPEDWRPCGGQLSPAVPKDIRELTTVDDNYFNPIACPCTASDSYCFCAEGQQQAPKNVTCGVPKCDSDLNRRALWPGSTGDSFYQCVSDETSKPKTIGFHCPLGTLFDYRLQRCIQWTKGIVACSVSLAHDRS